MHLKVTRFYQCVNPINEKLYYLIESFEIFVQEKCHLAVL